jgi:NTP pyrophosphatase (non-canonical NTP hydrolase)
MGIRLLSSVFTAGTPGKNERPGKRFRSGQAAGVGEFAPASDDRMHLTAAMLMDRLRGRSAGRAADGLWHPGHWNEAWPNCTKHIARQVFSSLGAPFSGPLHWKGGLEARRILDIPGGNPMMTPLADATATIAELKARVLVFTRERDWEQFHSPKNLSMALAAEAGELMEHFLWADAVSSRERSSDPVRRKKIEEEIADVVIYSLEFANVTGIDLAAAIESKLAANAQKYPVEKARGRSEKYTEL